MNTIKTLEQELDRLRQELNIPGMSVAVLHKQQVVLARGFGYADIENKMPATENTPYNIAFCHIAVRPAWILSWQVRHI